MRKIELSELKSIELEILIRIDKFCREHAIRYYLTYGTLLGAVRHGGFIPWDDDIDIAMPREDYERFFELFPEENLDAHLKMISHRDKSSIYPFLKIVDERTIVVATPIKKKYHTGAYVDIFPIDGLDRSDKIFRDVDRLSRWSPWVVGDPAGATTPLRGFVKRLVQPFFSRFDLHRQCDKIEAAATAHPLEEGGDLAQLVWNFAGTKSRMPYAFLEQVEIEFEGHSFTTTAMWDEFLTAMYGDYMTPPKPSERLAHSSSAYWLDSGSVDQPSC